MLTTLLSKGLPKTKLITDNCSMPATPAPPSPGPSVVTFNGVPRGSTATSGGAHLPQTDATLFARIEGDTNNVFSVSSLETDAYVHDPDLPPGKKMWEPVQIVDGAGPISIVKAEALLVTVLFRALTSLTQSELTATVVFAESGTGPAVFGIPIKATLDLQGSVRIVTGACPLFDNGIQPGQTQTALVYFESTALESLSGTFGLVPGSTTSFSSSPVTVPVTVPAQSTVSVSLPVTCTVGSDAGKILNVLFQFLSNDSRYNSTLSVTINVVFPVLVSNSNYFLEENGSAIRGLAVKVDIDSDLISSNNGWSMQLNGYSPSGNNNGWQQYVIYALPGSTQLIARIDNWDSALTELIRVDTNLATLPSATLPSGYSIRITLTNDAGGNITGATYAVTDKEGKSVGTVSLLIVGQKLRTTGAAATTADQAPIKAFQFNIVGDLGGNRATLTSGSGWITHTASSALSLVDTAPTYVNNTNTITAETANLTYGAQPSITTAAVVQSFQITFALAPDMQERVRARELRVGKGGHALPPPEPVVREDQPDAAPSPEPVSQRVVDKLKAFAKQRQSWI
jgi:hypothetical protein